MKTAVIAGATGLIGGQLLRLLLTDPAYDRVISLGRSAPDLEHPKLTFFASDFTNLDGLTGPVDDLFCCLGTTMKKAGSKEAFMKVDYEYPLALAKWGHRAGATRFLLVSALGADANSAIFYNQVKGKVEADITALGFAQLHIFRPGLLLGNRKEKRAGEDAAKWFYKYLGFLVPEKYQAIDSEKVARAMAKTANSEYNPGVYIHESITINKM